MNNHDEQVGSDDIIVKMIIRDACPVDKANVNDPREIKSDPWRHEKPTWYQS